jgi:hypothetical protein
MLINAPEIVANYIEFAKTKWDRHTFTEFERELQLSKTPDGLITGDIELYKLSVTIDKKANEYFAVVKVKTTTSAETAWFQRTVQTSSWQKFTSDLDAQLLEFSDLWQKLVELWRQNRDNLGDVRQCI